MFTSKSSFFAILVSLAALLPARAQDGHVVMYRNNTATSSTPYGFACRFGVTNREFTINFTRNNLRCDNDAAKSMVLQGSFRRGTRITVYGDSRGRLDDDWFDLVFKTDMAGVRYVIPTFEESFDDRFIRAQYHRRGRENLDGNVSRVDVRFIRE